MEIKIGQDGSNNNQTNIFNITGEKKHQPNAHNLPNSGVAQFVGRADVLAQLHDQLQQSDRVAISTLTGMGGIGKSELALQYAWQEWDKKTYLGGIAWLTVAESDPGLGILTFAQLHLGLTLPTEGELVERVRYAWQGWFRNKQDQGLIIFDDVRKLEQVRDFLPPQDPRFKVIITTRNEQIARNFNPIHLEVLSPDAAVELLAVFLPDAVKSNPEKAKELVKWLGYLPLGIELVGRYGQYMNYGLAELLEQLQAQKLKDESLHVPENAFMTAQRGVAAAFELSWGELSEGSQLAGEWISLFAESGINENLILALFKTVQSEPSLSRGAGGIALPRETEEIAAKFKRYFPTFSKWFSRNKSSRSLANEAGKSGVITETGSPKNSLTSTEVGSPQPPLERGAMDLPIPTKANLRHLVNLSLLTDVGNNNYELHTLIRHYLREKLEDSELAEEAKRAYGRVMVGIAQRIKQTLTKMSGEVPTYKF